jgi:hypothetical protein
MVMYGLVPVGRRLLLLIANLSRQPDAARGVVCALAVKPGFTTPVAETPSVTIAPARQIPLMALTFIPFIVTFTTSHSIVPGSRGCGG